jgi:uncharacterized protein
MRARAARPLRAALAPATRGPAAVHSGQMAFVQPVTASPPDLQGARIMRQQWRDLTFLHWRVDPAEVAPFLPPGTRPDVHDGATWIGLIPFRMVGAGLGRGPAVP